MGNYILCSIIYDIYTREQEGVRKVERKVKKTHKTRERLNEGEMASICESFAIQCVYVYRSMPTDQVAVFGQLNALRA